MKMLSLLKSFRKQFQKNEYNYKNNNIMSETMSEVTEKRYQWKKGENFGQVVTVESTDAKFTNFTNGTRIFNNIIGEFLEEIINGEIPLPGADKLNNNGSIEVQKEIVVNKPQTVEPQTVEHQPTAESASPLEELVEKLSKKNIEKFETTLNLNIPTKAIFNMLIESADEDPKELVDIIAKVAVSKIEINRLQEYLKEEITNYVNNYYNG